MYTLVAIGFLAVVGLSGAVTGLVAALPRARQGALMAVGAAVLAMVTGVVGTVVQLIQGFVALGRFPAEQKQAALAATIEVAMRSIYAGLPVSLILAVLGGLALRRASSLSAPRTGT